MRLLRLLFPFRFLLPLFLVVTATGLWLHWYPRFQDISWGLTEMFHVYLGWFAIAVYAGYQTHHLALKWGSFSDLWRILGLILSGVTLLALGTGVVLVLGEGPPAPWLVPTHFVSTFVLLAMLVIHPARIWTRWLGKRLGRSGASDPEPAPAAQASPSPPAGSPVTEAQGEPEGEPQG